MSDNTKIEWATHTFNPWWGCSRVSPACRFCYADRDAQRYGHQVWRRHGPRRMLSDANWARPLKWNRDARASGQRVMVFCASMADVFEDHPDVGEARERLWNLIEDTPYLIWQLLTKRPENVAGMAPWGRDWPAHVWLGTSVENQPYTKRIPLLQTSGAKTLFLSCEPMLGPIDLRTVPYKGDTPYWLDVLGGRYRSGERYEEGTDFSFGLAGLRPINWVICGGESGPKARPMHPEWARSLRDQCVSENVPFLFKQWGEWGPRKAGNWPFDDVWRNPARHRWVSPAGGRTKPFGEFTGIDDGDWALQRRVGRKTAGRELDGRTWDEYPHAREAVTA